MKCVIPNFGIRAFGKTIHCLTKIGDEIFMESRNSGLSLKTVNMARSAYVCFEFNRKFFNSFKSGLGNHGNDEPCCCKIMAKSFLSIFRGLSSLEKTVIHCNLSIDFDMSKISVVFHCKHGIIKTHQIGYSECETLKAVYDKDVCPNKLCGASRPFSEAIINFPNNSDEITLIAKSDEILVKNYIEDPQDSNRIPLTEVHLLSEEFDKYEILEETSVTFCLKELRAVIGFTDSIGDNLSIRFETCGKPVILSVDDTPQYSVDVVLASLVEEDNLTMASNVTTKSKVNKKTSNTKLTRRDSSLSDVGGGLTRTEEYYDLTEPNIDNNDEVVYELDEDTRICTNPVQSSNEMDRPTSSLLSTHRRTQDSFVDENFPTNQIASNIVQTSPSCLRAQERLSDLSNTQESIMESSGFIPSTPPPAKKFKSLFAAHDIIGGGLQDSILALDSDEEED